MVWYVNFMSIKLVLKRKKNPLERKRVRQAGRSAVPKDWERLPPIVRVSALRGVGLVRCNGKFVPDKNVSKGVHVHKQGPVPPLLPRH
jgi:hypothetical protein